MKILICSGRKNKVIWLQVLKPHWGCVDTAPLFLNLSTRWKRVVSFTFRPFHLRTNIHHYPLNGRLGGHQRQNGGFGIEKNFLSLLWIKTWFPSCPGCSL